MSDKEEIWKVYPGYPFLQASNLGRVRTTDRVVIRKNGKKTVCKRSYLKAIL